ncbi:hypothetical protein EUGRSUZ_F01764 [Eucalyptus grandis]|uniref:Uncharacterized protein n=2 Tax=Eucalyptus grandis TaxID=71139 RepID=A0ACC3KFC9_EUCGR|nr:hypothetical protein EUGRSUZ_F01764 [Eucalyptus grandis]
MEDSMGRCRAARWRVAGNQGSRALGLLSGPVRTPPTNSRPCEWWTTSESLGTSRMQGLREGLGSWLYDNYGYLGDQ